LGLWFGDIGIIPISPYTKKYITKPEKLEYSLNYNFYCLSLRGYQESLKSSGTKSPHGETLIG
jgi:hypothetical protein